jgi:hypothetical protein
MNNLPTPRGGIKQAVIYEAQKSMLQQERSTQKHKMRPHIQIAMLFMQYIFKKTCIVHYFSLPQSRCFHISQTRQKWVDSDIRSCRRVRILLCCKLLLQAQKHIWEEYAERNLQIARKIFIPMCVGMHRWARHRKIGNAISTRHAQ